MLACKKAVLILWQIIMEMSEGFATAKLYRFFSMFHPSPKPIPSKRLTALTISLQGVSNTLVSVLVGCDQWQKLSLNPDSLLDRIIPVLWISLLNKLPPTTWIGQQLLSRRSFFFACVCKCHLEKQTRNLGQYFQDEVFHILVVNHWTIQHRV